MRCGYWVSACVVLLCSVSTNDCALRCNSPIADCDTCAMCTESETVCLKNSNLEGTCENCYHRYICNRSMGQNCERIKPIQRQCFKTLLCNYKHIDIDQMLNSTLALQCANITKAKLQVCRRPGYIANDTELDCFLTCNETMEDSSATVDNMTLLSRSECLEVDRMYCGRPQTGRARECANRCVEKGHCLQLVKGILGEEFTRDKVEASANIIQDLPVDMGMGLRETIMTVQAFHRQLEGKRDVAVRYFNSSKSQKSFIGVYERLLDDDVQVYWNDRNQGFAPVLLKSIESSAELFAEATATYEMPFDFSGQNFKMDIELVRQKIYRRTFYQNVSGEVLNITCELPLQNMPSDTSGNSSAVVSIAVMQNLIELVNQNSSNFNGMIPAFRLPILSAQLSGGSISPDNPARLYFSRSQYENKSTLRNVTCVFWDFDMSDWSDSEVSADWNDSHFICSTPHLTSFAVLVTVSESGIVIDGAEALALSIVGYIGCAVSIVCLIATILALALLRKRTDKGMLMYIHLNLCIALLVGLVTYVAGIETATSIDWLCTLIAALLHYFFLAVFCWMLAEGIMLYLLLVRVFGNAASRWYWLLPLGWGLPVPIVAISVGNRHKNYGTQDFCWMSLEEGTIWGFIGPMIAIVMVNAVVLVAIVVSIVKVKRKVSTKEERKSAKAAKVALKSAFILLPLLGVTWAFGLLAVNENTTVFAWLFTIFNSLQGCFIFSLHVLRNDQVLAALRKVTCYKKEKDSVVTTDTSAEHSFIKQVASSSTGVVADSEASTSLSSPSH